jgi:phage shock protein PspC (stress-responsive transcriptional regulator)
MNKTVTANIGGFVFNIDEQAFETLQKYLAAIRYKMNNEEGVEEVMQDIEIRIAELFKEKLNEFKREVINLSDVENIIIIMGEPDVYGNGENSTNENNKKQEEDDDYTTSRQIYRDPDNEVIGGVCSGLAAYMNWDPIVIRLIFVLLFFGFGTGLFIYILLWIIIPEAKTASDRLRMRGEKVNVENIKGKFVHIKSNLQGSGKETGQKIKKGVHQLVDNFGETFGTFARIFAIIFASLMMVAAIVIFFVLVKMMVHSEIIYVFTDENMYSISYEQLQTLFFNSPSQASLGTAGFILLLSTIAIGLILTSVRIIFKVKIPMVFKIVTGTLSTLGVIFITICMAQIGYDFSHDNSYSEQIKLDQAGDTLYIQASNDPYFSENLEYSDDILFETVKIKNNQIIFGYPELKIKRSNSNQFEMIIEREAHGSNNREALARAENLHYKFSNKDSILTLAPYFTSPVKNKLRLQKVTITVFVPEGKTVHLGNKVNRIFNSEIEPEEKNENLLPVNTYLEMTDNGLIRK